MVVYFEGLDSKCNDNRTKLYKYHLLEVHIIQLNNMIVHLWKRNQLSLETYSL